MDEPTSRGHGPEVALAAIPPEEARAIRERFASLAAEREAFAVTDVRDASVTYTLRPAVLEEIRRIHRRGVVSGLLRWRRDRRRIAAAAEELALTVMQLERTLLRLEGRVERLEGPDAGERDA